MSGSPPYDRVHSALVDVTRAGLHDGMWRQETAIAFILLTSNNNGRDDVLKWTRSVSRILKIYSVRCFKRAVAIVYSAGLAVYNRFNAISQMSMHYETVFRKCLTCSYMEGCVLQQKEAVLMHGKSLMSDKRPYYITISKRNKGLRWSWTFQEKNYVTLFHRKFSY